VNVTGCDEENIGGNIPQPGACDECANYNEGFWSSSILRIFRDRSS